MECPECRQIMKLQVTMDGKEFYKCYSCGKIVELEDNIF
jgi:uncharacterized C2H2 Zn-finger protein